MKGVKCGSIVEINGKRYMVTAIENYGFFVQGRKNIILWSDEYEIVV